jgi:hypothetical protein
MEYNKLQRLARSRNIRITKNTPRGRRYLTASELKKKLKRRKLRSKKNAVKRIGFLSGLYNGLLGRSYRGGRKIRKLRKKLKKRPIRKFCKKCRKACKCRNGLKYRKGRAIKSGALLALKTVATGAAIQLGAEAAKRALQM